MGLEPSDQSRLLVFVLLVTGLVGMVVRMAGMDRHRSVEACIDYTTQLVVIPAMFCRLRMGTGY